MEIDVKNCPCYIDRPLHRYDKGCLIQSQAFSEQQTKEKPILRCDEIVGCPIKEQYKQLQQLKAENEELKRLIAKQKNAKIQLSKLKDNQYKEFCDMKQCLDEIEEILNIYFDDDWKATREIEKLIKQAKEGK